MLLDDDVVTDGEAKPGAFSGGFRCEERVEHFSFTSGGMPVPLSRIVISTRSPRFLVAAERVGS